LEDIPSPTTIGTFLPLFILVSVLQDARLHHRVGRIGNRRQVAAIVTQEVPPTHSLSRPTYL
jgi:hypothetical protein